MSPSKNDESFLEQKLAIDTCKKSIDSYYDILQSTRFTKSVIIRGNPGSRKTSCILYATLYAISKRKNLITNDHMDKPALQLGGKNRHNLFYL